jgi:hypothetical protein
MHLCVEDIAPRKVSLTMKDDYDCICLLDPTDPLHITIGDSIRSDTKVRVKGSFIHGKPQVSL